MKFFTKQEALAVVAILLAIILISLQNFRTSLRRARDAQRKNDIGAIANGISRYGNDFAVYPLASGDGKILACRPEVSTNKVGEEIVEFEPCIWGKDSLRDALDLTYPSYIEALPSDPEGDLGISYLYLSSGQNYQVYAALEGVDEAEYDPNIVARNLTCGMRICNFGRSSGVPLDKSIEEYENELLEQKL
ncbi:hypothetical protein A3E15_00320 [Candidatus Woesebacteria bacterium RIFCSPHIGHO2_12_FULL_42_9]|uniref:Type II secretion system protein GspG C-terminal domain-containing protein n=3 Tax=Candidatus Woeseibacteriota TaxID=1752722 RepID=A0A1F8AXN1_9BACT|nr:MAG: hypothetical protein A2112_00655 [Candidatus Woesebacteria bacterium GWA1_42_12]OGM06475.1 MAG: hypothetical protein A2129_02080 [Candidatus Woesebacteria bacterium GWC1_42_13]OGM56486.1 MAG: hypothetical protein A3E15_00320 [Candidatus Woesebacteria bacterium RIFCSPHIGHO2_12_FULL_42_9]